MENSGNSDFSGSSSNSTISSVDIQIQQLGEESINKIVPLEMINAIVTYVLYPISQLIEFALLTRYFGSSIMRDYIVFQIIISLGNNLITSVAKAGAQISQKSIAKNQVIIANTYYVHAVALQFILLVLYMIVGAVIKFGSSRHDGNYLIIRIVGGGICDIFGRQMHEFYKVENRNFLMFCQELLSNMLYVGLMCFMLENETYMKRSMGSVAIAYVISQAVVVIWSLFAIHHTPFLDADYRGCLKFSFKRLSPIRPKFLTQIIIKSVPVFIFDSPHIIFYGCGLIAISGFKIKQRAEAELFFMTAYYLISLLHKAISKAIYDTVILVGNYNFQIKKITRVFETLRVSLVTGGAAQLLIMIILTLLNIPYIIGFKMKLKHFLFNGLFINPVYNMIVIEDELDMVLFLSSLVNISGAVANPVVAMLNLEDQSLMFFAISFIVVVLGGMIVYCLTAMLGESPHFYFAHIFFEGISLTVGAVFLWYYFDKYLKLYRLNIIAAAQAEKVVNLKNLSQKGDAVLHESIMQQINAPEDDNEKQLIQKQKIQNVFNKQRALQNSNMFTNMRDSVRDSLAPSSRASRSALMKSARGSEQIQSNPQINNFHVRQSDLFQKMDISTNDGKE